MTDVVNTELSTTGTYIDFGANPTNNDSLTTSTVIVYAKPTAPTTASYWLTKAPFGTTEGHRFGLVHNSNSPLLIGGFDSTGLNGLPERRGTGGEITYGSWAHFTMTYDGTVNATGIHLYVDGTESTYTVSTSGSTAAADDTADKLFLLNRDGLSREAFGSIAWIARWNRVLDSSERATARSSGPLDPSLSSGLVLCWANQQDYSASGLTPVGRTTHADGDLPPSVGLGDVANTKILHVVLSPMRW